MLERFIHYPQGEILDSFPFCCGELGNEYNFAGVDSLVYVSEDKVIKVYKLGKWEKFSAEESWRHLSLYQEITNLASSLSERENWKIRLSINRITLPIRIVPIDKIVSCSCCGAFSSIGRFVEGKNMEEIRKSDLPFDFKELGRVFSSFSLDLDDELSVYGINIVPVNVKYVDGGLVVTDLCADVSMLRRVNRN